MATYTNTQTKLDNLNDYQKSLLTRLSYVSLNIDQFKELTEKGEKITISDLSSLLSDPNASYLGTMKINDSLKFDNLTKDFVGVDTSNKELIQELVDAGLGDLNIVNVVDDPQTGFQAICFSDSLDNKGFSYRGTDVKDPIGLGLDVYSDVANVLTNESVQLEQANNFFEQYSNSDGKNYLYGHSLGGFLAEDVFANNYENIENTFVINPLDINEDQLDTQEKIDAFNDPEKLSYYVIGEDLASTFNSSSLYEDNIKYIKNNNDKNNELRNHLIESASFDEDKNFITTNKEEAYKGYEISPLSKGFVTTVNFPLVRPILRRGFNLFRNIGNFTLQEFKSVKNFIGNTLNNIKNSLSNLFNKNDTLENSIGNSNLSINKSNSNISNFRESLNPENYINDITYTRSDYEKFKSVLQNPMEHIDLSEKNNNSLEIKTTENDSFLDK